MKLYNSYISYFSDQIQNLQKEVASLKRELQNRTPGLTGTSGTQGSSSQNSPLNMTSAPSTQTAGASQQYGGYYYYPNPYANGAQNPAGQYPGYGSGAVNGYDSYGQDQLDGRSATRPVNHTMAPPPAASGPPIGQPHFDPAYHNGAAQPYTANTIPKQTYLIETPYNNNTIPYDNYMRSEEPYSYTSEPYRDPYPGDVNKNYRTYHDSGDSDDSSVRRYYIPSKERRSSPSRRRSRRDDFEREDYVDGYTSSRYNSPHRKGYRSPGRVSYRSPDRISSYRNSPVRGYSSHHSPVRPVTIGREVGPMPGPPGYASHQQYIAQGHQPVVQGHPMNVSMMSRSQSMPLNHDR